MYASQYGFRKNRSTVNAITELVCHITNAIENKQNTLSVFVDLSKACDTIDHKMLLHKIEFYGVRGLALNWFQSYLTDRKQYVPYNNVNHRPYISHVVFHRDQSWVVGIYISQNVYTEIIFKEADEPIRVNN